MKSGRPMGGGIVCAHCGGRCLRSSEQRVLMALHKAPHPLYLGEIATVTGVSPRNVRRSLYSAEAADLFQSFTPERGMLKEDGVGTNSKLWSLSDKGKDIARRAEVER